MRSISCASACGIRSRARCSRSPTPDHRIRPCFRATPTYAPIYRATASSQDGSLVDEPTDVTRYWRDDLVSFLLGCSFTFEWALAAAGLPMAHQQQGVNVPMYITDRRCVGAGPFEGPLVVSMRPFAPDDHRPSRRDLVPLPCDARQTRPHRGSRSPWHHGSRAHPTSAIRWRSRPAKCRCSGHAG